MDSSSPYIYKENNITRSVNTDDDEKDKNKRINISNNLYGKKFNKNFRFNNFPPKKYDFFDNKNEIIIKFIVCVDEKKEKEKETTEKKKKKESEKENEKKREIEMEKNEKNIEHDKKKEEKNKKIKKITKRIIELIWVILLLYFFYVSNLLIKEGIYERRNLANLLQLSFVLLIIQILLIIYNLFF